MIILISICLLTHAERQLAKEFGHRYDILCVILTHMTTGILSGDGVLTM